MIHNLLDKCCKNVGAVCNRTSLSTGDRAVANRTYNAVYGQGGRIMGLVVWLTLLLGVGSAVPASAAPVGPPALPSTFYGGVTLDGNPAPTDTPVTAAIDDVTYATTTTLLDNGLVVYQIKVPGDDPMTEEREGGRNGATVVFQVAGLPTLPTAIWNQGGVTQLDLLASTTPPAPISYTLAQERPSPDSVGLGEAISFTVRITNTGNVVIASLPLTDTYDPQYLTFTDATPAPDFASGAGQLHWNNVVASCAGTLAPSDVCTVVVNFSGRHDTTLLVDEVTVNTVQSGEQTSRAGVRIVATVPLTLAGVSVTIVDGQVHIHWRTINEGQVLGFFLVRQDERGAGQRLHSTRIPAQHAGEAVGADYSYIDATIVAGHTYRYLLEVINRNGESSYIPLGSIGQQIFLPWLTSTNRCCEYVFLAVVKISPKPLFRDGTVTVADYNQQGK